MNTSDSTSHIWPAFFEATKSIGGAVKSVENDFFKSSYADLPAVMRAYNQAIEEQGLFVIQSPKNYPDMNSHIGICTRIVHAESGEWIEDTYFLPMTKQDPQAAGSAITYARRYHLAALFQVPQVDTDAEAAMFRSQLETIGEDEQNALMELLEQTGDSENFLNWLQVETIEDIPAAQFDRAKRALEAKVRKMSEESNNGQ